MQLGMAFWGSKALLTAVELRLFGTLSEAGTLDAEELRERLGLHPRSAKDFFDALLALGMLQRHDGKYSNTSATDLFLDPAKPTYVGGLLEMANARLYQFWGSLTEGVRTGQPQSEVKTGGDFFATVYADPERLAQFADPLPHADVLIMGHILHDWNLDQKRMLLEKAYAALPEGGSLIVYDAIIDDDRRENAFGLLMSLNMLIEGLYGFDYTGADCRAWMAETGFSESYVQHLVGPDSMVVGIK